MFYLIMLYKCLYNIVLCTHPQTHIHKIKRKIYGTNNTDRERKERKIIIERKAKRKEGKEKRKSTFGKDVFTSEDYARKSISCRGGYGSFLC